MITLLRLRADAFKGLRRLDIAFPTTGSILIEGHNEAGKSTLFEAIYVALYGRGLVGEADKAPKQEELIAFDQAEGWVDLIFAVGATRVRVHRQFTRARGQIARITITRPGTADETRHGISAVNERVLREIGGLDRDTLRNSCFVEQKELGRLEALSRSAREAAIERLLGLERLSQLEDRFRAGKKSAEERAKSAREQVELAHAQATAHQRQAHAQELQRQLVIAQTAQLLDALDAITHQGRALNAEATAAEGELQEIQTRIARAATLDDAIRAAQEHQNQEERTAAQAQAYAADRAAAEADLAAKTEALQAAEARAATATAQERAAEQRDALHAWAQIAAAADHLREYATSAERTQALSVAAQARYQQAKRVIKRNRYATALLFVAGVICLALNIFSIFNGGYLLASGLSLVILVLQVVSLRQLKTRAVPLQEANRAAQSAQLQYETAQRASGIAPGQIEAVRAQLRALGIEHDPDVAEAERRAHALSAPSIAEARQQARDALAQASAARAAYDAAQERLEGTRAVETAPGGPAGHDVRLRGQGSLAPVGRGLSPSPSADGEGAGGWGHLVAERASLDVVALTQRRDQINHEQGRRQEQIAALRQEYAARQVEIARLCAEQEVMLPEGKLATRETVLARWPQVGTAVVGKVAALTNEVEAASRAAREAEAIARAKADLLLADSGTALEVAATEAALASALRQVEVSQRAQLIITEARGRIMRQVLPATERNMCMILPILTAGRYHDVRLTPPEGEDGALGDLDYRIRVWDPTARRYVGKLIFSGGARDQCSLALRLAFALATLPQELGIAPGFLFLDEPLSAFDGERATALVELLTTGLIAQSFAQVVVISHQHAYTHSDFRYHLRMERGRVVASDLPAPDAAELVAMVEG